MLMGLLAMWELFHQILPAKAQASPISYCDENGVNPLWTEESPHCLNSTAEFSNSSKLPAYAAAAAATVCHQLSQSSIIYFQTVCKALQHSLLCPYTGKRRERTSERLGEQKHRSLWNPLLGKFSYVVIQGREEREIKPHLTAGNTLVQISVISLYHLLQSKIPF